MAFGEAMKICWLPVIYSMGAWPSIAANMEIQLSQHSWRKKHVGLNTTPKKHNICDTTYDQLKNRSGKHLVILLFYMQFSTIYYGSKDPLFQVERKMRQMSVSILKGYLTIHTIPCVTGMPTEESANGRWNKHSIWCWLTSTAIF